MRGFWKEFYTASVLSMSRSSVIPMIHEPSDAIMAHDDGVFLYPCYEENCISNLPGTILDLFGVDYSLASLRLVDALDVDEVSKVVLLVMDGFGYNQFLRYHRKYKFLAELAEKCEVFPLTSIFPSQTTNALTTLNTGLTPQEHGLFEYILYLKEVDRIVNTLRFEPVGSHRRNELQDGGFNPNVLFDGVTVQGRLREAGVKSFTFLQASYAYSPYARVLFGDSTLIPSWKTSDMMVALKRRLEQESGPAYFFVHLSNLDTISHEYGPDSYEYGAELSAISYMINKELIQKIDDEAAEETFMLVMSDHGGVGVVPEKTTYLNGFPELIRNLKEGRSGQPILPTGSARDVFLHAKEDRVDETRSLLVDKVGEKAEVVETKEAIADGLFGRGKVGSRFAERAGNLLILPRGNETVWFEHFKEFKYNPVGQHGGLTREEMLVPFAAARLSQLKKG